MPIFYSSDNLPYEKVGKEVRCIADEIPFEIPESWEWVRLENVGSTNIGLTYSPSDKCLTEGIVVLRSNNIKNGLMDYNDCLRVSCQVPERALINKGDILICARNGSRSWTRTRPSRSVIIHILQSSVSIIYFLVALLLFVASHKRNS